MFREYIYPELQKPECKLFLENFVVKETFVPVFIISILIKLNYNYIYHLNVNQFMLTVLLYKLLGSNEIF